MRVSAALLSLIVLFGYGCDNKPAAPPATSTSTPDNTGVNERDSNGATATPFDQSEDQSDIDLTARIRSQVVDIPDLSVDAQNVKIITNGGRVILRGPVKTAAERDAIAKIASDAAGATNVTNQLEVAP